MTLISFSVQHADHGIDAVQAAAPAVADAPRLLAAMPGIAGALSLVTCNRAELYIEVAGIDPDELTAVVRAAMGAIPVPEMMGHKHFPDTVSADIDTVPRYSGPVMRHQESTIRHLFDVTSGLDSMVIGEREIISQVRAALRAAKDAGTASAHLIRMVEHALKTSKKVATATELSACGRSVVSVALDLADAHPGKCLLIGTGSYAGAVVQAVRNRGFTDIEVFSRSGRADAFATSHELRVATSLTEALLWADYVVCCSGTGGHVLGVFDVEAALKRPRANDLVLIDLALNADINPDAADLPGVSLITLDDVATGGGGASPEQLRAARDIVDRDVAALVCSLHARTIDPALVALRARVLGYAEDEIAKLQGDVVPRQAAEQALRRLAARILHAPTTRAHEAAAAGRVGHVLAALDELYDIVPDPHHTPTREAM